MQVQQGVVIIYARVCKKRDPAPVRAGGEQERSATVWLNFLRPGKGHALRVSKLRKLAPFV